MNEESRTGRIQKKLVIAVMVFGIASLVYWAVRVVGIDDKEGPVPAVPAQSAPINEARSIETEPLSSTSAPPQTSPFASSPASPAPVEQRPVERTPPEPTVKAAPTTAPSPSQPIALAAPIEKAFAMMRKIEGEPNVKLHDQLSSEPKDPEWSYEMEQRLSSFFLSRASQLGIEVPVIDCRKSGCEVQMTSTQKPAPFQTLAFALQREPWYGAFEPLPMHQGVRDGQSFFLMLLRRR